MQIRDSSGRFAEGNVPWNKRVKCPPHYWVIDSQNVGRCKYCHAVKDFGELQKKHQKNNKSITLGENKQAGSLRAV